MHEAGLARGVAKLLRESGLRVGQVRLIVRGGHHDPAEFEAGMRVHLVAEIPEDAAAVSSLEIRRVPFGHYCPSCDAEFGSVEFAPPCPSCGAETLPDFANEQIDVELLEAVQ
jgi:Zn finger protein HypA/HybF involved in hydrogenase expression